ncbi:MAG: glycosyltransferase family 9 protein [Bacteroidetes bacterium]|nr:glycosyltransferase family 9 protein [Bacteroidota bacterium]
MNFKRIIISRTDSIGDVILTLPLAGILKKNYPNAYILFLGSAYTKDVIECCEFIDEFIDWTAISKLPEKEAITAINLLNADTILHVFPRKEIAIIAKKVKILNRIGTTNRTFHWFNCNKLVRLSRKNSDLHESQLNIKLLKPFKVKTDYNLSQIAFFYGLDKIQILPEKFKALLDKEKFNLILHPKSKGSAREWGLENFASLIELLPVDKYNIFISGTSEEAALMQSEITDKYDNIIDLTGKLTLTEFIAFIAQADGLIAASTGPLHIAAALGKVALGIYPPIRPMHPGRWMPVGKYAHYFVNKKTCIDCRKTMDCHCMKSISPEEISEYLEKNCRKL